MKKIAYVLDTFPNLSETFIVDQIIYLASTGHKVGLYYENLNPQQQNIIDKVISLNVDLKERWICAKFLRGLLKFVPYRFKFIFQRFFDGVSDLRLNQYDTVLAHFGSNGLRLAYCKKYRFFKKHFITFFHGFDVGAYLKDGKVMYYKELLKTGNTILAVNGYFKDILLASGSDPQKTHVFHMGIDCQDIDFRAPAFDSKIKMLSVCRLVEKKGILYVIKALNSIHKTHPHLDWQYDIIGDGPLLNDLKRMVTDYQLQSKISFLGSMSHDEVKAKMAASDMFLLPSITADSGDVEGIPVVLMEAMGTGVLVCSTYHSGIPELVEHQKTGLLAHEKNISQLSDNIVWAIEHPEQSKIITENARAYVEQNFNKEILYKQLLTYL